MVAKLRDLEIGQTGVVTGYQNGRSAYRSRLLAMGLTRGTEFTLMKVAPMGDPVELELRGFNLSLRKDEADVLIVESSGIEN